MAWCLVHYFVPGRGAKYCNECACVWSVLSVCLSTCISHKPQVHTCYVWPWLGPSLTTVLLWSPYVIGQTILFSSCNFYLLLLLFFPRLISAAASWMLVRSNVSTDRRRPGRDILRNAERCQGVICGKFNADFFCGMKGKVRNKSMQNVAKMNIY